MFFLGGFTTEAVADLLSVVRLDAHIVREKGPAGGLGLFFWLHLANHSCCPNAFFHTAREHTTGRAVATLYALRPLDSGEEVCISYVDGQTLLAPMFVRRRIIQNQFGFLCVCSRCREEESEDNRRNKASEKGYAVGREDRLVAALVPACT